jgi:CBS domain-containing protein
MPQKVKSGNAPRPRRSGNGSRPPRARSIRDVMTPDPRVLEPDASITDAAALMREADIGDIVVVENNRLSGILTDRDIVVRVLAEGYDPAAITVGDICSREITAISASASVDDAVKLIRDRAIRRLPVVDEEGGVVGVVTIGDIARARDRSSALADVSAAPPNT